MSMGGFTGSVTVPTLPQFERLADHGKIEYVLVGGGFGGFGGFGFGRFGGFGGGRGLPVRPPSTSEPFSMGSRCRHTPTAPSERVARCTTSGRRRERSLKLETAGMGGHGRSSCVDVVTPRARRRANPKGALPA